MDGIKPRSGSFLPKVVPIRKPWRRSAEIERAVIRRQMEECERLSQYLNRIQETRGQEEIVERHNGHRNTVLGSGFIDMRSLLELYVQHFESVLPIVPSVECEVRDIYLVAKRKKRSDRMEAFVVYLLHLLQQRGDIIRYGWYKMYKGGELVDGLGIDQWCWLAQRHGGGFCPINTKSSSGSLETSLRSQEKKLGWRRIVFLFYPGIDPKRRLSDEDIGKAADKLLLGLIASFGRGNGMRNGRG